MKFFPLMQKNEDGGEGGGAGKADALREIQTRLIDLENGLKAVRGSEAENIRAVAREEMKKLEDEIAILKMPKPLPEAKKEESWLGWLFE